MRYSYLWCCIEQMKGKHTLISSSVTCLIIIIVINIFILVLERRSLPADEVTSDIMAAGVSWSSEIIEEPKQEKD